MPTPAIDSHGCRAACLRDKLPVMHPPTFTTTGYTQGFTLIEQIACLAVTAILTALAVPAMGHLAARSAIRTTEGTLFNMAHAARNHAITHNADTLLCPSLDGRHCDASRGWQPGWIVARDHDRDGQPDSTPLTYVTPAGHARVLGTAGRSHVRFRPDGSAAGTNITLTVCADTTHAATARVIVISNAGRIREAPANTTEKMRCAPSK